MAIARGTWVQAGFFAPAQPAKPKRTRQAARNYSRVSSDPAVARAVEEQQALAHSVKLGLARILAQRSATEREQLRQLFAPRRVA